MGFPLAGDGHPNTMTLADTPYDVAILGGGLAGLSLSISLSKQGRRVILFERERYPFHRVCGEYISMESWPFLERLGIPLSELALPRIRNLLVSAPDGYSITQPLDLGGFGVSRFTLDALLAERAKQCGVDVRTDCKVNGVVFTGKGFDVDAGGKHFPARVAVGSFGKRSNLDVQMQRPFILKKGNKLNNYIGIKYHIRLSLPEEQIALHNFYDGYCGVSAIEGGRHCLCYLTTAANLEKSGNNLRDMEKQFLYRNPFLKDIFSRAVFDWDKPETIARISFERKGVLDQHLLMTGDAAGMISPLCGNGMSMALRSGQLAEEALLPFLDGAIPRETMEQQYLTSWKAQFSSRLRAGRVIQSLFGKPWTTKLFLQFLQPFPIFTRQIIRKTHGDAF
jgi:menaquinone-9 beta-reductase